MAREDMHHMDFLGDVLVADAASLREKEATYRGSWKKRGGVGAFMMLARKWDRLENILSLERYRYDIFDAIATQTKRDGTDGVDGSVLAEVRDLRRYLALVEAEMCSVGAVPHQRSQQVGATVLPSVSAEAPVTSPGPLEVDRPGTPEDGGHHAAATEEDEEELVSDRQPAAATDKEYQSCLNLHVRRGTMAGRRWSDLYHDTPSIDTHRWIMKPHYIHEYGK